MGNKECSHFITRSREGEKGLWCYLCGEKVHEVESRQCGDCAHTKDVGLGNVMMCEKNMIGVFNDMYVTFEIKNGTCWESKK